MKSLALGLALLLTAPPQGALAQTQASEVRERGWLSALGLGLLCAGLGGVGMGLGARLNASDANDRLTAYVGNGRTPLEAEASTVLALEARAQSSATLATVAFIAGGALLASGVTALIFDGRQAKPAVAASVMPSQGGFALFFSARF